MTKSKDELRTPEDVARRCVALYALVAVGNGVDRDQMREWLESEGLRDELTPKEAEYFASEAPSRGMLINATWFVERVHSLVWALGLQSGLDPMGGPCDVPAVQDVLPEVGGATGDFIKNATLRSRAEIDDALEAVYQAHWKLRDAKINKRDAPADLNIGVVQERHHALNWLTGYGGLAWDDVTTDT